MTDVAIAWDDQVEVIVGAFAAAEDFSQTQLDAEIRSIPETVSGSVYAAEAWGPYFADTLHYQILGAWSAPSQSNIEAVVAGHVPVEYETRQVVRLQATTGAGGLAAFVYAKPYRVAPCPLLKLAPNRRNMFELVSMTETGCTFGMSRTAVTSLLGVSLLSADVSVVGQQLEIVVFKEESE